MSNEMISAPRELLERALRELLDWEAADEFASVKRTHDELRALLAKPAEQHQGEPVGWYKPHWNGKSAEWRLGAELTDAVFPEMWEPLYTRPAEQHRGEPVALQHMAVAEDGELRWMTGRKMQNCELYAMPDGSAIRSKLYAEQPAPVAVVLPERNKASQNLDLEQCGYVDGWNACLDEVALLNAR